MPLPSMIRVLAAAALVLAGASAQAYSSLIVFGDSLSDSGNNAQVLGTAPGQGITGNSYVPTLPYASGTYSNGAVWTASFAAGLGLDATPSLLGGGIYAYGGARTSSAGIFPPSLERQVDQFLQATGGVAAADGLYVIAGGGNNGFDALASVAGGAPLAQTVFGNARSFARDVGQMVDTLQAAGAQDIIVWNAPNLALTPLVQAQGGDATDLAGRISRSMNRALNRRLAGEAGVQIYDIYGSVGLVAADPAAHGLANVTDACGAIVGCDPDTYLYWDGIHPTSAGQALIAQDMLALAMTPAVPEPATALMWALGLGAIGLGLRRRA